MKKNAILPAICVGILAGLISGWVFVHAAGGSFATSREARVKESAYDRVMRLQTLRCGYVVWTPFLMKDPNSGQLSGLFYDYTEALGAALHLKIEWTEEMGWGDFPAALNSGRIDAMCGGSWPNATRGREIDFVQPVLYQPTYAYARVDDHRFDNNLQAINDPAISIIYVEGSTQAVIASNDFPKAKTLPMPDITSFSDSLVGLADGKADVALAPTEPAYQYMKNNPGKIYRIEAVYPLRLFGNSLAIPGGEERLRRMLDIATNELLASGKINALIDQYKDYSNTWLRVSQPYQKD